MNDTTFQGDGKVAYVPVVVNAKPKPITNADRIRSMTDEELANEFAKIEGDPYNGATIGFWLDWLREATDG